MKKIINLGCGSTKIPGSVAVDAVYIEGYTDVVHNLEITPYPFESNSIDEIHFYHVLEHLHEPIKKIEELHRILKPGGILYMRVPHFSSNGAFTDITHIRPFSYFSFDIFDESNYHHFYTKCQFKIQKKEIKYFGLYPNCGVYEKYIHKNQCQLLFRPIVRLINFMIRLSPIVFERFWCYWVGGACEIVVEMKKI